MATTQENNEVADTMEVKSDMEDVESATLKVSVQQPDSSVQAETKLVVSDKADCEVTNKVVVSSEQAETQPVSEEVLGSELTEIQGASDKPGSTEVAGSEHTNFESVSKEPTDIIHAEIDELVSIESQPVNADAQPDSTANVDAMSMDQVSSERVDQKQTSSAVIHSEDVSSEQVNGEAESMSKDIPEQQPSRSELAYSHSELVNPPPIGSELVSSQDHMEFAMYNVENLHEKTEFVKMEHVHPEPMHSSDLEQQVSSELLHQLQVSSELMHPIGSNMVHSQPLNSDLIHPEPLGPEFDNSLGQYDNSDVSSMQLVATDMVNSELAEPDTPADPETQPSKRRKKKSIVWEHFTIEHVSPGCRRACCKVCKQSFAYSTGSKVAGTSHLKRHIAKGSCPLLLRQQENNQLTPYAPKSERAMTDPPKRRFRASNAPCLVFDQDRCRHEIARMIIMHEYPLHMIEHPGFVAFVQNLQPRFDMVNFNTVQGDCVATYLREKQNLQMSIDKMPGLICLAVDMWTSSQRTGYVFLQGQFVDHKWKLNKRLLNIVMEPFPESDTALSHAVATCLSYWNSDNKLCSVTFNQSLTDAGRENMRGLLSVKNPSILNGQLLVGSCLARTLSGMALDVLATGQDAVRKIRSSVKYVKTCDAHEDKFLELKMQLQVPSEKSLTLDSITRWNTTYDMLVAACELKEVFTCLDTSDPEYKDAPTMEDWKQAENICMHLRLLLETANVLLAKVPPSTNVFFHEVWKIQLELTRNASSEDPFVSNVAGILLEKFLKYWRDSFMVLAIAVAMDPRFKMKLVEFSFTKLFGEEAPSYIRMVDEGIHELFHEYVALPLPLAPAHGDLVSSNGLTDFDMYIMETNSQQMKSELDQYLDESLLPRVQELDVLGWWKLNMVKYPTLSKMARDVLCVPLSSVGPDYVFETVSREMDQYRSSLRPETLEALMCARDWLQYQEPPEASNGHVKIEVSSNQHLLT